MVLKDLSLGEMVVWDREIYPTILPSMIEKYGEGPFKVIGLRLWSKTSIESSVAPYMVTIELQTPSGAEITLAGEWVTRTGQKTDWSSLERKLERSWEPADDK